MIKLESIKEPYWKYKALGIADHKITDDFEIECVWKKKDGSRLYPNPFRCSKNKAKLAITQTVKGVLLRIIPISQMEEVKQKD